jgi:hypothetical protein
MSKSNMVSLLDLSWIWTSLLVHSATRPGKMHCYATEDAILMADMMHTTKETIQLLGKALLVRSAMFTRKCAIRYLQNFGCVGD